MQTPQYPRKTAQDTRESHSAQPSASLKCSYAVVVLKLLVSSPYRTFPKTAQDDQVDAWSEAASRFRTSSRGMVVYYKEEAQLVAYVRVPLQRFAHENRKASDGPFSESCATRVCGHSRPPCPRDGEASSDTPRPCRNCPNHLRQRTFA
jgi:hypothetical protein